MQVKLSTRHGHLNDEHQAQLREKAEKLLTYFDRLTIIEVTVDLQKAERRVEIIALAEHKHEFVGHADNDDVMVAFGLAMDKVKHQIKHYKEQVQDHRGGPSASGLKS